MPNERLALHRRALAALAGRADPARLAYHAEGAGDGDAVLRFAPAAAERAAAAGAHREAAAQYARALRFADGLGPRSTPSCTSTGSHQCYMADHPDEAAEDLQRALEYYRALGDRRGEGDALRALSNILWCPGLIDEAEHAGHRAVAVLEPLGPGRELAMAYANLAALAMNHEDARGNAEWGGRALELARSSATRRSSSTRSTRSGRWSSWRAGQVPGRRPSAASSSRCDRAGSTMRCARTRTSSGPRCATAPIRSPTATSRRRPSTRATPTSTCGGSTCWASAPARSSTRGGGMRRPRPRRSSSAGACASPLPVIIALTVTARLRARRGDPDPWSPLDEARALAGQEFQRIEPVAVACAETAWLAGDRDRVVAETDRRPRACARAAMPAG